MKKLFIILLFLSFLFPGIVCAADITSKEQLNQPGIIIGVSQGSVTEEFVKNELPNATLAYFTDGGVMGYQAVAIGKLDAYIADLRQMEMSIENGMKGVHLLDETMNETLKTAIGISQASKIPDLEEKTNKFLSELRENGTLQEMFQRWVVDGNEQMPEIELDDDPNYHLIVGTAGTVPPYSYYKGTELNGHDIELAYRFAEWLDADIEFKIIDFNGLVPAAMSGKIDCIISDLQVSDERQENFTFSDPIMEERLGIMVRGEAPQAPKEQNKEAADFSQYDGKHIGVVTGSTGGPAVKAKLPNAKISYFNSVTDMLTALKAGKVDAIVATDSILKFMRMEGENISLTNDYLKSNEIAAIFPKSEKGQKLETQYSEFVKKLWDDGTMNEINAVWFGEDDSKKSVLDYENMPGTNGILTMAVDTGNVPFVYLKDGKIVGYDVDVAARFCEAYGYRLVIQNMSFPAIIPSVVSGKSDFSACDIAITPERAESVLFSEPTYYDGLVLAVPGENIKDRESGENSGITSSLPSMDGKTIGTLIGSTAGPVVEASFPNAKISYFDSIPDTLTALRTGKVDASVMDDSLLRFAQMEGEKIIIFDENLKPYENAAVFPKNEKGRKLEEQYSEFIKKLWDDGTMAEIDAKWFGTDDSQKTVIDYEKLPATNGTLTMASTTGAAPFVYMKDNQIVGYEVEIAARFCETYGYRLEIVDMAFSAILPSVISGKADFSSSAITITPERSESVLFSEPLYRGGIVLAIKGESGDSNEEAKSDADSGITDQILAMAGKRFAVVTGSICDQAVLDMLPTAKLSYFDSVADMLTALKANKVDAFVWDDSIIRFLITEGEPIQMLDGNFLGIDNAAAFAKNEKGKALEAQYSEYVKKLWDNGTIAEIDAKWYDPDDSKKTVIDYENLPGPNGTLIMAVDPSLAPFTYVKDNRVVGYEVDIAAGFCEEYGYRLEVQTMSFGAMIPAIVSGKADFASSCLTITPERAESVLFSEPIYRGGEVAAVLAEDMAAKPVSERPSTLAQLNGKRIAVTTGSIDAQLVQNKLPEAKLSYFESTTDMLTALKSNKVDAMSWDDSMLRYLMLEGEPIVMLDEFLSDINNAAAFAKTKKGKALEAQYSEYVKKLWDNGTIAEIDAKWFDSDDSKKTVIDYENLPGPNGTLIMAVDPSLPPFTYVKDNRVVGYEIEIAAGFCEEYGYRLKVQMMSFGAMIPAIVSGKADFASSNLTITPEREESVLFSEPIYRGGIALAIKEDPTANTKVDTDSGVSAQILAMAGKRFAVLTGSICDQAVLDMLPTAKLSYFDNVADMLTALKSNKVDAFVGDDSNIRYLITEGEPIKMLDGNFLGIDNAAAFAKDENGKALETQYSEYVKKLWDNGTIAEIDAKWYGPDESKKTVIDYENLPATNGTLIMAVDPSMAPFAYVKEGRVIGYEVEIAAGFCEEYGYRLEVQTMSFGAMIPAIVSGKADFASSCLTITPEREESVLFSEPVYRGREVAAVLAEEAETAEKQSFDDVPSGVYSSLAELSGKKIGIQTGTSFDQTVLDVIPDAEIVYLNNKADLVNSLLTFKIDGFVVDEPVAEMLTNENDSLTYIPDYLDSLDFSYVFPMNDKGEDLCDDFSEFLEEIKEDGTLEEIERRWFSDDESIKSIPDYTSFPASNGPLRLAVEALYEPFCYILNNQIVGYDIDIAVRFCEAYGYGLEIIDMSFDAVLPAVQTGKADFGVSGISITPERAESVLFSEPNYSGGTLMVVLREDVDKGEQPEFTTFAELNGKTVSMLNGAPFEELINNKGTEVGQFTYFNNMPDVILALKSGKTDAFITNNAVARLLSNRNTELAQFPVNLEATNFGFAFAKGSAEREKWLSAYNTIPEKTKQDLWKKWTGSDESKKILPEQDWPGTNGTVTVAACDTLEPMSYKGKDGELIGFDEEIILLMAKELDVHVNFTGMEFSVILSYVQSGKALLGTGSILITKERAESVDFIPYYPAAFVMLVRSAAYAEELNTTPESKMDTVKSGFSEVWKSIKSDFTNTWESIKSSFEKTFIREDRWKLIVVGIRNTLVITVFSVIFGTVLGFLLLMLWRNNYRAVNFIMSKCMWLVQGTPMVVLLMILFYIIFGSVAIDGIIVAIIGFSLTFGASVFGLLQIGVGAIDNGQYEAAYALGYSGIRTFFRIILPQAIPHVMNAYKGEIVSLLKATAIVGYIAVQDLTKMGDIIRSRTYEAFFPLIAVTIIYFLLEMFLGLIIRGINVHIDPKRRKRSDILKGVKTND